MKSFVYVVGGEEYDTLEEAMARMNTKEDVYLFSIQADGSRNQVYRMFIEM